MNFNFNLPTKIIFGCGTIQKLNQLIEKDIKNILIVTDKNVFNESNVQNAVLTVLKDFRIEIFDDVKENPSLSIIKSGVKIAKKNNSQLILGIGGGSPMDAAKGIAAFVTNKGDIYDYVYGKELSKDPLPIACIPTTSGTGSEVTPYAIFTDVEKDRKICLSSQKIFPKYAIIDPTLTYSMPRHIRINTGADTLTHAIEAYLSKHAFPLNDLLALQSIKIVLENLNLASQKDKEAMNKMAYASMLSGITITHASTILLHIMAYPLTVFHNIPHGKANAILLPTFIEYMKRKSNIPKKVQTIDSMFEIFGGVNKYINGLDISTELSSYGINMDEFEKFAQEVIVKDDIKITPTEITIQDIIDIYKNAY